MQLKHMKAKRARLSKEFILKIGFTILIIVLSIVWLKRKEIAEMKFTQKKMEFIKAVYNQDIDSAKQVLEEMVDSSFYLIK